MGAAQRTQETLLTMTTFPSPFMDGAEDSIALDSSTAPTTPEGSYMSSPVLRPQIPALEMGITQTRPVLNICCVGAGYVGGPTAAVIAFHNPHIRVTVVDLNATRIRRWNSRHPPIYEPGLEDIVRVARDGTEETAFEDVLSDLSTLRLNGRGSSSQQSATKVPLRQPNLFFSTEVGKNISEADIILIAVNTPTKSKGKGAGCATDMTAFEAVTADVARHAKAGAIIVEKSTVPCRTAQMMQETMAVHRPGMHFEILSNPEFLAQGTAIKDLLDPDRVLIGSSPTIAGRKAASTLASVYAAWVPQERIVTTNVWSSELAKLVANAMLAQRISSINSIAAVCEQTGADVDEVARAIGMDARIGNKFLKAGIGYGGSCFKKDVLSLVYLAQSLGLDEVAAYWRQVQTMNEYARNRFASRVLKCMNNTLSTKKIAVLGYSFKKNTNDTRESPALEILRTLVEEGPRELAVFDPCCNPEVIRDEINRLLPNDGTSPSPVQVYENAYEACAGADAVLITTEFDEFKTAPKESPLLQTGFHPVSPPASAPKPTPTTITNSTLSISHTQHPRPQLVPEPACDVDCPDCRLERSGYASQHEEYKPKERIDWAKIGYHMKKPRWVFDGRGVVDVQQMELLGFRVESVGR